MASNLWKYLAIGIGSAAVAGLGTYFGCRYHYTKKIKKLHAEYNDILGEKLTEQRNYYISKARSKDLAEEVKEAVKEVEMTPEEAVESVDDGKPVIYDGTKKRASEIVQENTVREDAQIKTSYHTMYGGPTIDPLFDPDEDIMDRLENDPNPHDMIQRPYLISRDTFYKDDLDNAMDYAQIEMMYFIGDCEKDADGNINYLPVLYSNGRVDGYTDITNDGRFEERCLKADEIAEVLGQEWKTAFGSGEYGYDENECMVRNDALKTEFIIIRDDRMYKCVIADCEPGDPFDYSQVR